MHTALVTEENERRGPVEPISTSWIDEMMAGMKQDRDAASARRLAAKSRAEAVEVSDQPIGASREAWEDLLSVIRKDIQEFNCHPSRAGRSAVRMTDPAWSLAQLQFEVYLPERRTKLLVLTLEKNRLYVLVRPDFPVQRLSITLEATPHSPPYRWVLDVASGSRKIITVPQLSEYLLKPILSSAEID